MQKFNLLRMKQVTQAVILAAGLGTRLKSFTTHKPKALMDIAGTPSIIRVIRQLVAAGIHDIAINLHHHGEQIEHALGRGQHLNANLYYSYEPSLLDSGGGVRTAMDLLPNADYLAVYNADIMSDIDLSDLSQRCPEAGCALALVNNPKHHPNGDFALQNGLVRNQGEHKLTFSGVSVWHKEVLTPLPNQQKFSLVDSIHQRIQNESCAGLLHQGYWFDIGRPHDLIQARRFHLEHAL